MGMESFKSPVLPLPPEKYDKTYFSSILRVLSVYFAQLDSKDSLNVGGFILTDLTDVPQVLPDFSLYRQDRFVKIVLPGDVFSEGVSGTGAVGTATVTIS